jgi:hypothetical protein
VASCSSRDWRKSSYEMLSCTSSLLSRETSSSRCLRVVCAPSSVVRSCWSQPCTCFLEVSVILLKLGTTKATSVSHSTARVHALARSSLALCSASSRSTSAIRTFSPAEAPSAV